jgi:3-oxoacyl-[acyl-carrier-protein] synthase-3
MNAYITDVSSFLPNDPIENDQMESILGMPHNIPSRTRKIILRNNKIQTRHYAINPKTGETTHTNAQLAAEAVRKLKPHPDFSVSEIECLCCGTSSPDQLMPGHASMVHGELRESAPLEIVSTAGICLSGVTCLKYAAMNVASGLCHNAVSTGSDLSSTYMRARICGAISAEKIAELDNKPFISFEADFLRWMLSDGAGAVYISDTPAKDRLSLKIEWIDIVSHANTMEPCMYSGAQKTPEGGLIGWREFPSMEAAIEQEVFPVKQDARLLNKTVIPTLVQQTLPAILKKHGLSADGIDWFLPHYSSEYFRQIVYDGLSEINFTIPFEKWFTNLTVKGNTGAASIYIMLEELFHSGKLQKGQKVFAFIPESGRFSVGYMLLSVC